MRRFNMTAVVTVTAMATAAVAAVASGGCGSLDRMILDGTIKSTREASTSFDRLSDYEVASGAAAAGLAQAEGMSQLAPENADALFMLTQGWAGYAAGFIEDRWEDAQDREDEEAETAQAARARAAYERAIEAGIKLCEQRKKGFAEAMRNSDTMAAYLAAFEAKDAENLLWLGVAWLGRGNVAQEDPEMVASLFVGVALLERSVALDERAAYATGLVALGAYHARSRDAELAQARQLFERALALTGRGALTVEVVYAQAYACNAGDRALYGRLLGEALAAKDPLPAQRLENVIAKRKARRYLGKPRLGRCGWQA